MQDLDQLLQKKKPTGKELGIIFATDSALALQARKDGKVSLPIMDTKKFNNDVNALSNEEWEIFNKYKHLSEFLNLYYNIAEGMIQHAEHAHAVLYSVLSESALTEDTFAYVAKMPVIMTQKQYEAEARRGVIKWAHEPSGGQKVWTVSDICFLALNHYRKHITENPRRKNPLQPVKKKYLHEPVTSDIILARYNKATNNGYYELPDGKRSDQMTPSRWKKATQTAKMRRMEKNKMQDNAEDWKTLKDLIEGLNTQRIRNIWEGNGEPQTDAEREALIEAGFLNRQTFKLYEEPPANLSKWDIIKDSLILPEIYPAAFGGLQDPEAFEKEITDFCNEFPEVIKAIFEEVDKESWIDIPLSGTPVKDWKRPVISLLAAYDLNLYGIADSINKDYSILFFDNDRAKYNGVAIIQNGTDLSLWNTDHRGYYKQPYLYHSIGNPYRLEDLFEDSPEYEMITNIIKDSQESLLDSHYFIYNWNILIDMIEEIYQLPEMGIYRENPAEIEMDIDKLNNMTMDLYNQVFHTDYGEAGDFMKSFKLEAIKKHLGEINYTNAKAPNENINQIYALLTDVRLFAAPEIIEGLMLRRIKECTEE